MEIWVPAFRFEGLYSVSSAGRVRSEDRVVRHHLGGPKRLKGALMSPCINMHNYQYLTLCRNNIRTKHLVHRLVLMSFTRHEEKLDARHLDGDRGNNCLENLAWGTRSENMQDCVSHGRTMRGAKNWNAKLDPEKVRAIRLDQRKQVAVAAHYGVDPSVISDIKRGKLWAHV
jgi:hypothetical protein